MRKLFWCGCAALMVCAAGVYWAAGWAERNPQAPMASCARLPWQLLTDWNPIVQVGRTMGAKTLALIQGPKAPPMPKPAVAPACPADPGVACQPEITEVIDLSEAQDIQLPQRGDQNSPGVMPTWDPALERELAQAMDDQIETVLPGEIEEAEQPVKTYMPAADEDETPAVKPTPIEKLVDIFQDSDEASLKDAETLPMPRAEDADEEDADVTATEDVIEEIPMPSEDECQTDCPMDCHKDCENDCDNDCAAEHQVQLGQPTTEQFGQPMSEEAMRRLAVQAAGVRIIINEEEEFVQTSADEFELLCGDEPCSSVQEPELLPMPREEEGVAEESETIQPEAMQPNTDSGDCQEVPNIEQRCPECPASGCPRR